MEQRGGRYLMLLSVHGLVRGTDMELGRDEDTGGQVKYVVELARALAEHPEVDRVDLVTRRIQDDRIDPSYGVKLERLAENVRIVRIPCGPKRYLAKETLWPHLDSMADNVMRYLRAEGRSPDLVHGHYADAGYVAGRLSGLLNVPMAFTGHSLGRVKRERLLAKGSKPESIERRYRISRRIDGEEFALDHASFVVASTHQEVEDQYATYDNYDPKGMVVIPPGVDLGRFRPPGRKGEADPPVWEALARFLHEPAKPLVLALSRPDPRKNIATLIHAFGRNAELREKANLAIVAGTRDDLRGVSRNVRKVLTELLYLVDLYDLYGSVAYPKQHSPEDVPDLYRLAASRRGVFVNPALTEPFGLTLLEAAASGLPVVATNDGGPQDIIGHCKNGLLVDPLDAEAMGVALLESVSDRRRWSTWSRTGLKGVRKHYSWAAHVDRYMRSVQSAVRKRERRPFVFSVKRRLMSADRLLVSDIDNTLIGDHDGLEKLLELLAEAGGKLAFAIATGRSLELTRKALKEWDIPTPTALITSVGSEIWYGPNMVRDAGWEQMISFRWKPDALREAMQGLPGLELQPTWGQGEYKISYFLDPELVPPTAELKRHLRRRGLAAKVIRSHEAYLDLLPLRASKGMALRYFAARWGLPPERILAAGDSGNDEEMLTGNTLGVVVGNHDPELDAIRGSPRIYFADGEYAWGILEGIEHYDFLGRIEIPDTESQPA
jgi:sucrose-phosphate synthase